jgi:hypothetical protein
VANIYVQVRYHITSAVAIENSMESLHFLYKLHYLQIRYSLIITLSFEHQNIATGDVHQSEECPASYIRNCVGEPCILV